MNKLFFSALIFVGFVSLSNAGAPLVNESPIFDYGTPGTAYISTTTLTKVPSTQTSGRMGIFLSMQSTGTLTAFGGFLGNCTSTSLSSAIRPIVISTQTLTQSIFLPLREDVCVWLTSMDVATSTSSALNYQEIKK